MNIQLFSDDQILSEAFRKKIIDEIEGPENKERKRREAAKWEIWRDQVRKFVLDRLKSQGFQQETIEIMNQRATNVNLFKKIVSKKARSYAKGVDRSVPDNVKATADLEAVCCAMDLTGAMKRADRYRKAARNCVVYIYPEQVEDPENAQQLKWTLTAKVYFPHLYDAIPDSKDHERMRCMILSPFADESELSTAPSLAGGDGRNITQYANPAWRRDHVEQTIANAPRDTGAQKKEYVWWTAKYHLTTDDKGVIVSGKTPEGNLNPIKRMPAFICTEEQDGEFWALGGDDLVESTVLLNLKLTDMESILHMQGWGQLVITGEGLSKKDYAIGPQKALELSTDKGASTPTDAKILQHDPHTDEHLKSAEVLVALTLTTNNLSVKTIAADLNASSAASAIAKMVDEADNLDDISEDQDYYGKKEKEALRIAESWLVTLRPTKQLIKELADTAPLLVNEEVTQFHNQEQVFSEAERIANLKARKDLGLDTLVDLIKRDNPGMSDEQATKKALSIHQEKMALEAQAKAQAEKNGGTTQPKPGEQVPSEQDPKEGDPETEDPEEPTGADA